MLLLFIEEEAETVMNAAMGEWRGRPEEQQLILASGDLLVQRGSADAAIQILSTLTPEQPNYQAARIKIANIYLHEKKDKRQFAIIYK
jgi:tetratricopeptide repeat protein 21B